VQTASGAHTSSHPMSTMLSFTGARSDNSPPCNAEITAAVTVDARYKLNYRCVYVIDDSQGILYRARESGWMTTRSFLESSSLDLFVKQSGRQYWANQT
jgi:regulation of enolase protein 1 (concanavalin A-like superfamily)